MAYQKFAASGTYFLKDGAGYVRNIACSNAGISSTFVINDIGPAGTVALIGGITAFPITVGVALNSPIFFPHGLQLVLGGTVGEFDVDYI
jgi:hypothetical protein